MSENKLSIDLDLDSFLDILTNVIGVMILIATVIALQLQSTTTVQLGRPLLHDPPPNAERVWLECRDGRLFYCDMEKHFNDAIEVATKRFGDDVQWDTAFPYLNSLKLGDENFTMRFEYDEQGRRRMRCEFNAETTGGYHLNAEDRENDFEEWLTENYQSESHYFIVLLFQSGMESFSRCQKRANELHYEMGWTPSEDDGYSVRYIDQAPAGWASEKVD